MTALDADLDRLLDALEARAAARPIPPLVNAAGLEVEGLAAAGRVQVNPGDQIVTTWGNLTFNQSVNVFATTADRDTQWPVAPDGACCYTLAETTMWQYRAGAWAAIAGAGAAPVTAGGLVSRVDAAGMAWVAKPGVNAGAWRLARDVLHSRVYRAAAWSSGNNVDQVMAFDTVTRDPYGLWVAGSNAFVAPLAGVYRISALISANAAATQQYNQAVFYVNGTVAHRANTWASAAAQGLATATTDEYYLNTGDTLQVYSRTPAVFTGTVGSATTSAACDYVGTG
jgi:hypothetical protein